MSMHLRNSRDLMVSQEFDQPSFGKLRHVTDTETASRTSSVDTEYGGWWTSKTSLEQKLIVLSSVLFILSFCLVISVIVINNRKPDKGEVTTITPTDASTGPTQTGDTVPTTVSEASTVAPVQSTATPTGQDQGTAPNNDTSEETVITAAKGKSLDPATTAATVATEGPVLPVEPVEPEKIINTDKQKDSKESENTEGNNRQKTDTKSNSDIQNSSSNKENIRTEKKRSLHDFDFLGISLQKRKVPLIGVGEILN